MVEIGNHELLIQSKGHYVSLVAAQEEQGSLNNKERLTQ